MDEAKWEEQYANEDSEFRLFSCALKLSVSYAASIGGTGTLIGSGPNIVLKGQAEGYVKYQFLHFSATVLPDLGKCFLYSSIGLERYQTRHPKSNDIGL